MRVLFQTAQHDRAGRGAQVALRLAAGLVAAAAFVAVDLIVVAPWRPSVAVILLVTVALMIGCELEGRRMDRQNERNRAKLRDSARRARCGS